MAFLRIGRRARNFLAPFASALVFAATRRPLAGFLAGGENALLLQRGIDRHGWEGRRRSFRARRRAPARRFGKIVRRFRLGRAADAEEAEGMRKTRSEREEG